ncbi:MAG: AraC family transcriptional regulator [Fischerella sp. CENA71]|nr:AraC family transcriptional regulator [Fischerella sp. CENA71]
MLASDLLVIDFAQKDDVLKLYPEAPLLSSDKAQWDGIQLQYHRHPPHQLSENHSKQHRIIIHDRSPSPPMVEEMIEHRFQKRQFGYGDVTVVPADVLNSAYWNTEYEFITLSFEARTFARHTFDLTTATDIELVPSFSKPDQLIYSLGFALKSELESSGVGSRLYIDSLTAALMTHLLRHYSAQRSISRPQSGLAKRQLQKVIDFIHQNLEQDLALAELAAIVQMSPSYFSTLFKHSTGLAPHQYVIQCRVDRAKQLLRQSNLTIAEIAYSVGFTHQSHLSRHFKRLVGVSPKVFIKSQ